MIDMWSCFWGGRSARKSAPQTEKKCIENREETHQLLYVVNLIPRDDKYVVKRLGSKEQRTAFSFFCSCGIVTLIQAVVKAP